MKRDETTLLLHEDEEQLITVERDKDSTSFTFEESLTAIGTGKFHTLLLLLCGWAVSSEALEIFSVSFLLPSATCDLHLSSEDKGWLNAMVFVGMMCGSYMWGCLADRLGRSRVLVWSLTMDGMSALLSSFSQVFWLFLLLRFFCGMGLGGSIPLAFTYFTEFQNKRRRGPMISTLCAFWMCGNFVAAGVAWLVIPRRDLGFFSPQFNYNSWRIFVAICTIPSLSSAVIFTFLPESPTFLLKVGKEDQAIRVLKKVHRCNKSQTPFNITRLVANADDRKETDEKVQDCSEIPKLFRDLSLLLKNTRELFKPAYRSVTCLMMIINFSLSFGYYGMLMWFPEIFNRIEVNGGTICDPDTSLTAATNATKVHSLLDNVTAVAAKCDDTVSDVTYMEAFLTALSSLPGNLITIFLVNQVGRKFLIASSAVVAGLSTFFFWFVHVRWQSLLMSCLFGAVSIIGMNMLFVIETELFPTHIRTTAFGTLLVFTRLGAILGNVSFGFLVDANCFVPMAVVAFIMSAGGLLALKLPNTSNTDMH